MRSYGTLLAAIALLPAFAAAFAQQPAGEGPPEAVSVPATAISLPHTYPTVNGSLAVAPGLVLPNGNLPWVLDDLGGKQVLVPLHHATLTSTAATSTLPGAHSSNVVHRTTPIIFIHTSDRTENSHDAGRLNTRPLWLLLPAVAAGNVRSITRPAPEDPVKPATCTPPSVCIAVEAFPDGWLRVVPTSALAPGEYVLMPAVRHVKAPADVVYDFTLDPAVPLDRDAVRPAGNSAMHRKRR